MARAIDASRVCTHVRTREGVRTWICDVLDLEQSDLRASKPDGDDGEKGEIRDEVSAFGDLGGALQNGIVLCYLMNALSLAVSGNRAVPRIQEATKKDYQLKENVIFFLAAVKEFGVPRHRWFSLPDLIERQSMVNVVECLAALAGVAAEEKGFDIAFAPAAAEGDLTDEAIMKSLSKSELAELQRQLSRLRTENAGGRIVKIAPGIMRTKLALFTGGDKKKLRRTELGIARMQAIYRGYKAREAYHKLKRDIAYRQDVSLEILKTESDYCADLALCVEVFLTPLKTTHKGVVSVDNIALLFGDLETIAGFAALLAADVRAAVEPWNVNNRLGGIFLKIMDFLKCYRTYIQNFERAIQTMHKCRRKSKKFDKFLLEAKAAHNDRLRSRDLTDFLIMPVQRVPRYNMLLTDLAKHTWPSHPDSADLEAAVQRMGEIAVYLNEQKRLAENRTALLALQYALKGSKLDLSDEACELLFHGTVPIALGDQKVEAKKGKYGKLKTEPLCVYMLSNALLVARGDVDKVSKVEYRDHWDIIGIEYQVHDTPTDAKTLWKVADAGYIEVRCNGDVRVLFRILCERQLQKTEWVKNFARLLAHAPTRTLIDNSLSASDNDAASEASSESAGAQLSAEDKLRTRRLTLGPDAIRAGRSASLGVRAVRPNIKSEVEMDSNSASPTSSPQLDGPDTPQLLVSSAAGDSDDASKPAKPRKKQGRVSRLLTLRSGANRRHSLDPDQLRHVQQQLEELQISSDADSAGTDSAPSSPAARTKRDTKKKQKALDFEISRIDGAGASVADTSSAECSPAPQPAAARMDKTKKKKQVPTAVEAGVAQSKKNRSSPANADLAKKKGHARADSS